MLSINPEETKVILIGTSRFPRDKKYLHALPAVERNIQDLRKIFGDQDVIGVPEENILTILNEPNPYKVTEKLADACDEARDTVIVYYAGHGILGKTTPNLYLAARDSTDARAEYNAIPFENIRRAISGSGAQKKVLIMDCCFSGRALEKIGGTMSSASSTMRAKLDIKGVYAIASAPANKPAIAPKGEKHTAFTGELLDALGNGIDNGKEEITLEELYEHLRNRIRRIPKLPEPQQANIQDADKMVIARNRKFRKPLEAEVSLPAWMKEALGSGSEAAQLSAVGALAELSRGSDGKMAALAREELERIQSEVESPVVRGAASGALGKVSAPLAEVKAPEVSPALEVRKPEPVIPPVQEKARTDVLTITTPFYMELVRIPAGEFLMGSDKTIDKDSDKDEQPQHTIYLNEYYIGKYPVTNEQYAVFESDKRFPVGKVRHPVVDVSWREAMAFCDWLSKETGMPFRLPTEAEWEKAASWDYQKGKKHKFPWGDRFYKNRCNTSESGKGSTTPVDFYSEKSASPCGVWDMVGNVWEWCSSLYKSYPYDPEDGRENLTFTKRSRVRRGGSFEDGSLRARCATREYLNPYSPWRGYGFRVVWGESPRSSPGS